VNYLSYCCTVASDCIKVHTSRYHACWKQNTQLLLPKPTMPSINLSQLCHILAINRLPLPAPTTNTTLATASLTPTTLATMACLALSWCCTLLAGQTPRPPPARTLTNVRVTTVGLIPFPPPLLLVLPLLWCLIDMLFNLLPALRKLCRVALLSRVIVQSTTFPISI
jgi:hypothetical protein